jgi:hypothetical protein
MICHDKLEEGLNLSVPLLTRKASSSKQKLLYLLFLSSGLSSRHLHQSFTLSPELLCMGHSVLVTVWAVGIVGLQQFFLFLGISSGFLSSGPACFVSLHRPVMFSETQNQRQVQGRKTENARVWKPKSTDLGDRNQSGLPWLLLAYPVTQASHPTTSSFRSCKVRTLNEASCLQTFHHHGPLLLFLFVCT